MTHLATRDAELAGVRSSDEPSAGRDARRLPWVAVSLSFLSAGIGHVYCGRIAQGLALFGAWLLLPLTMLVAANLRPNTSVLVGLILLPVLAILVLYLAAAVDAFRQARRIGKRFQLKDYNRPLVYGVLIVLGLVYPLGGIWGVRSFVMEAFVIPTKSMSPAIRAGDRVLVNKLGVGQRPLQRGELIVFRSPVPGQTWIKRVVALPGDTIELSKGEVRVNGVVLRRERAAAGILPDVEGTRAYYEVNDGRRYGIYLREAHRLSPEQAAYRDFARQTVPPRHLFVLGDNRDLSRDSRDFGWVHQGDLIGSPDYLFMPGDGDWSRFGPLESAGP